MDKKKLSNEEIVYADDKLMLILIIVMELCAILFKFYILIPFGLIMGFYCLHKQLNWYET